MNQNGYADVLPSLKTYQWMLWVAFYISMTLRLYTNWFALAALALGLVKRHGIPKFNKEFLQRIIFDENLQMLPYLGVLAIGGGQNFILYIPLLLHAFLEVAPLFKEILDRNPSAPIISIGLVKDNILKGVQQRAHFIELKSDVEVYIGLYLIAVWFIGWSSFITIMMYWQIMRVRYMLSASCQAAFRRVDKKITDFTRSPRCPGIVGNLYGKIRGFLVSMADMEQAQAQAGGRGGLFSKCSIF